MNEQREMAVRPLTEADYDAWRELYRAYAVFYRTAMTEETEQRVWAWLMNGQLRGYGAVAEGALIGIAHWQRQIRPLRGAYVAYLHDLFVLPERRNCGVGGQLLARVNADAGAAQCTLVRWATKADNTAARYLYDNAATATDWVIYEQTAVATQSE